MLLSKYKLVASEYQIAIMNDAEIRIVQLSDVHDAILGKNNEGLLSLVDAKKPDLIFITGDTINSHANANTESAQNLIAKLVNIAPVYISLGNQEYDLMQQGVDIASIYENAGATVLDFSYEDIEIKGSKFRIGGIFGYCQPMAYSQENHRENESEFLMEFQNTDARKLLLCHMPVCWLNSYSLYDWDVDVVFSGHIHGGQIRIPFIGGLWAPDMGWFPGDVSGIYTTTEEEWDESQIKLLKYANNMKYDTSYYEEHTEYYPSYLVLSRGLGNTDWVPRFNNAPEIVVVDLVPNETFENN